jgi:hypothetical protein
VLNEIQPEAKLVLEQSVAANQTAGTATKRKELEARFTV